MRLQHPNRVPRIWRLPRGATIRITERDTPEMRRLTCHLPHRKDTTDSKFFFVAFIRRNQSSRREALRPRITPSSVEAGTDIGKDSLAGNTAQFSYQRAVPDMTSEPVCRLCHSPLRSYSPLPVIRSSPSMRHRSTCILTGDAAPKSWNVVTDT